MASRSLNLYVGMTSKLFSRVYDHKMGLLEGHTKKYNINRLVYFEEFKYFNRCKAREDEIKKWGRAKKIALIKTLNPTWIDLAEDWYDDLPKEMQIPRSARNDNPPGVGLKTKKAASGS